MKNVERKKINFVDGPFIIVIIYFCLLPCPGQAQLNCYAFEQIDSLQKVAPRPVVVFIHTDWCKYCAAMENTTLRHERVVVLLNEGYYFVSFDAEQREDIHLRGRAFSFQPSGHRQGIHELAEQLGTIDGTVTYPTLCVLNANYEIVFQHNRFIGATDLVSVLEKLPAPDAHLPPGERGK